jgi:D-tyrosyl-tRNA(Tyr) deacylase
VRALLQRVSWGRVRSGDRLLGEIGPGLVVLLGITHSDTTDSAERLARKVARLRIFSDAEGKMNLALPNVGGSVLVVSQFTLYADTRSGNRPGYSAAAAPETAIPLYEAFVQNLRDAGFKVETGEFGADMQLELLNDGPVTIWLDDSQF